MTPMTVPISFLGHCIEVGGLRPVFKIMEIVQEMMFGIGFVVIVYQSTPIHGVEL
jgi:hypothetical protein